MVENKITTKDTRVFKHFSLQYSGLLRFTLEHLS